MINKVILVGNVGADPEVRSLENGAKVARIRLATTERIYNKEKNETKELTEWHNITLWRGLADVADKYVRKGSQLYVEGKLRTREYDKNGTKCFATEIIADECTFAGNAGNGQNDGMSANIHTTQPAQASLQTANFEEISQDDDLPF